MLEARPRAETVNAGPSTTAVASASRAGDHDHSRALRRIVRRRPHKRKRPPGRGRSVRQSRGSDVMWQSHPASAQSLTQVGSSIPTTPWLCLEAKRTSSTVAPTGEHVAMQLDLLTTITKAPRRALDHLASTTWRALAAGSIEEAEAATISAAIEDRRSTLRSTGKPADARFQPAGVRGWGRELNSPRVPVATAKRRQSIERRRRLAASGPMPPALAALFTVSELAVLRIVGDECREKGRCDRTLDELATRAGCCRSSARNAIRAARQHGLLHVEERRLPGRRNLPNVVSITSPEWGAWLKRGPRREAGDSGQNSARLSDRSFSKHPPKPSEGSCSGPRRRAPSTTSTPSHRPWRRSDRA